MKLFTYYPSAGLETSRARASSSDSRYIAVAHGITYELIRRADLDGIGPYYTTPERALRAFVERGEARLVAKDAKLSRGDRRDWRAAISAAKRQLEALPKAVR